MKLWVRRDSVPDQTTPVDGVNPTSQHSSVREGKRVEGLEPGSAPWGYRKPQWVKGWEADRREEQDGSPRRPPEGPAPLEIFQFLLEH